MKHSYAKANMVYNVLPEGFELVDDVAVLPSTVDVGPGYALIRNTYTGLYCLLATSVIKGANQREVKEFLGED